MNFQDLVPPLDLCKKIPAGEFEDSAFVWMNGCLSARFADIFNTFPPSIVKTISPAPTVQEIMEKLPWARLTHKGNIFYFEVRKMQGGFAGGYNPAELALQVWLKLKGIENE